MRRRLILFGAALLIIAVAAAVAGRTQPGSTRPAAPAAGQTVAVTSLTRSCPPAAPGAGPAQVAMIAASSGSAPAAVGTLSQAGAATLSAVPAAPPGGAAVSRPPEAKRVTVSAPDTVFDLTVPGPARPVSTRSGGAGASTDGGGGASVGTGAAAVAATGQMARGFEAEQVNSAGLGLVSCMHPGSDMWFVGAGTSAGAPRVWLYLMNTGTVAASADVTILTDTGQQNGLGNAITVAPDQVVAENVAPFVRDSQALALHVQTSSGQVAASVWEGSGTGGAWVPQAAAPSTTLVIPGLTVASSAARLFVTVPGATDARLKVVAYTPAGSFTQFASAPVDASATATTPVTLSSLGASAAGLELASNVPIVAGVLVPGAGIGAFTAAASPVTQQGVVAGNPGTHGLTVGLLLTAPAGTASARITVITQAGAADGPAPGTNTAGGADTAGGPAPGAGTLVTVHAGRTLAVAVPKPPGSKPFAIVLTPQPGSGPLYAARVVTSGTGGLSATLTSLLPVASAPAVITLPPVRNSYAAVLP